MTKLEVGLAPSASPEGPAGAEAPVSEVTVILPPRGWQAIDVGELWTYHELLYFLTWRDVKIRYKQTLLGASWALLQPALMMVVFTIFFGRMAGVPSGGLPYPLFAYAGFLPWTFFATAVTGAGNSVIGSERLITKIYFPRLIVPFAAVAAALVDFAVALIPLALLMAYYGVAPGWGLLLMPVMLGFIALLALGLGAALGALNVAYRDFRYVIPFLIQLGMFATPTVYMQPDPVVVSTAWPSAAADGAAGRASPLEPATRAAHPGGTGLGFLLILNPMTPLIGAFRASVLGGPIAWRPFVAAAIISIATFLLGCLYFRRGEDSFADVI